MNYPWKRLWYQRERPVDPGPSGFTVIYEFERWSPEGPRLRLFEQIAERKCLILLGDAGAGKTHTLKEQADALQGTRAGSADYVRWANLADYQTAADLADDVFRHPDAVRCLGEDGTVHLFLDSFDEGVVRLETLSAALRRLLGQMDVTRLVLRIASRPTLWPVDLGDALISAFGEENVGTYILAPLTEEDAEIAARAEGLDADLFLAEVRRLQVGPLAAKPVTLRMLLAEFRATGALPKSQTDLYREGCLRFCQEWRPSRRYPAGKARRLTPEQTLDAAARVAAAAVLSGRARIWTGRDHGDVREGHVTVAELCTGTHPDERYAEADVWETLECGLFSDAGDHVLQFTHRSFAEFLAAYHLHQRGVRGVQLDELLTLALDGERWLVPQLLETAAWLEALSPGRAADLLERDADAWVLASATIPPERRSRAADALLRLYDSGEEFEDIDLRFRYAKLCHPEIAAQVRPFLVDGNRHPVARRAAASIAGACSLTALQDELADLALDDAAPATARQSAVRAMATVGDLSTLKRLRPLATDPVPEDTDDEIKGGALEALWPRVLSVEEVLASLTRRKVKHLTGTYMMFVTTYFAGGLQPCDLPKALQWLARQPGKALRGTIHADAARSVMRAALPHMADLEVLYASAELAVALLVQREELLNRRVFPFGDERIFPLNEEQRRRLLVAVVERSAHNPVVARRAAIFQPMLATAEDVAWVGAQQRVAPERDHEAWTQLVEVLTPRLGNLHAG